MPYDDRVPQNLVGGGLPTGGNENLRAWYAAMMANAADPQTGDISEMTLGNRLARQAAARGINIGTVNSPGSIFTEFDMQRRLQDLMNANEIGRR